MDKLNQTLFNAIREIDKTLRPLDNLWHPFIKYTGQIMVIIGIFVGKWEIIGIGAILFITYSLNQLVGSIQLKMDEMRSELHNHLSQPQEKKKKETNIE